MCEVDVRAGQFKVLRCGVAGMEAVEAETQHAFPRHVHEQFGIGLIHRGAHTSWSSRGRVEARAGDVITCNPGEVHDGAPIGRTSRAWRMLYLDPSIAQDAASDRSEGRTRTCEFALPVLHDDRVGRLFLALFRAATAYDRNGRMLQIEGLLLTLLERAAREQSCAEIMASAPAAISRARARIDGDPAAPMTLSDLARESGLSRFQVLRAFVRATGLTPHAYLVQRRVGLARRLIASRLSLADAAIASGFSDQSHMTRTFVRTYGFSPGAYADAVN